MEQLSFLIEREVIIAFAVIGGVIATIGSYMVRRDEANPPRHARAVLRFGYGLTAVSMALFIIAGFATAYR